MKKIIGLCVLAVFLCANGFALESDLKISGKEEIVKFSDEDLTSAYIDAAVEIEASKTLHNTSGFMPKEYKEFKDLLRYRILLLNEIKKRKLEAPAL